MLTIQQALTLAAGQLIAITDTPQLEADILLGFVLKKERSFLYAWPQQALTVGEEQQFNACIARRLQREPVAYITGHKEFWSLTLQVSHDTLVPRPETELLVEKVLSGFTGASSIELADLGTGSGAIALALAAEQPGWKISAIDNQAAALAVAQENAQRLGLANLRFYCGDWCAALPHRAFDVIVSNPPYIAESEWADYAAGLLFEPRGALVSGDDGLAAIRDIVAHAKHYLRPDGFIFLEHGAAQGQAVRDLLIAYGYKNVLSWRDLSGQERVSAAQF